MTEDLRGTIQRQNRQFDYRLVEALAAVLREGGFERAAQVLFLTQSAVSQRIRQLEEQCGQPLLVRARPPYPTPAGTALLRHWEQVRLLESELRTSLEHGVGGDFVSVPIGVNDDSLATWFLPTLLETVQQKRILLDLRVDDQDETHRLLRNGEVMGCISTRSTPAQGCVMEYVGYMRYRLLASPMFRSTWLAQGDGPDALLDVPILAYNRKDDLNDVFFRTYLREGAELQRVHYIPSSEQFVGMTVAGLACALLPDQQTEVHRKEGRLVDLMPGSVADVHLYWHYWNIQSSLLGAVRDAIAASGLPCS